MVNIVCSPWFEPGAHAGRRAQRGRPPLARTGDDGV